MRMKSLVPRNAEEWWGSDGEVLMSGDVSHGAARTDGTGMQTVPWRTSLDLPGSWRGWESSPFRQGGCHFPAGRPEGRSWNLLLERDSHEPGVSYNNQDTRASFQRCRWVPTWRQDFFSLRVWKKALGSFSKTVDFVFRRLMLPLELLNIQKCEMVYMWVWPSREKSCGYLERGTGPS